MGSWTGQDDLVGGKLSVPGDAAGQMATKGKTLDLALNYMRSRAGFNFLIFADVAFIKTAGILGSTAAPQKTTQGFARHR